MAEPQAEKTASGKETPATNAITTSSTNSMATTLEAPAENAGLPSLTLAATAPAGLTPFLFLVCIITHTLFAYGQWAPMWHLSLTTEDISLWANATSSTSKFAYDQLGLDHEFHFVVERVEQSHTNQDFTYGDAVQELWEAKGMSGVILPRIAAVLLLVFSGIWPHLLLILLQHSWMSKAMSQNQRTRILGWLALLAKWSLVAVLVVCVMVGVLNLEWIMDPSAMKEGILNNIHVIINLISEVWSDGDICTRTLKFDAHDCGSGYLSFKEKQECFACKKFVDAAFYKPDTVEEFGKAIVKDIHVSGHGAVQLSVAGLEGTCAFCAAVIFSVLLSATAVWYNNKYIDTVDREVQEQDAVNTSTDLTLSAVAPDALVEGDPLSEISQPLLLKKSSRDTSNDDVPLCEVEEIMEADDASAVPKLAISVLAMVTLIVVGLAIHMPSMGSEVDGAIPKSLKNVLDIDFDHKFSLLTLQDTAWKTGGVDLWLMVTFTFFLVVGPLLRALLVVVVAIMPHVTMATPSLHRTRSLLSNASTFLAAFSAWDVFVVAMMMVELLMPSITSTLVNTPVCALLDGTSCSCLVIHYNWLPMGLACLVLGWMLVGALAFYERNVPGRFLTTTATATAKVIVECSDMDPVPSTTFQNVV